jgi:hypothetical protein
MLGGEATLFKEAACPPLFLEDQPMITYFYWMIVFVMAFGAVYLFAVKFRNWKGALAGAVLILGIAWAAYFFYFQQIFVKRWGGVMTISVPEGQRHVAATWKDDNLWVENYDPSSNACIFSEYSKGNLLQGKVTIQNCNPLYK